MNKVGIIGFGEAGSAFAEVLAGEGATVLAFDKAWDRTGMPASGDEEPQQLVTRCGSLAELLASVDIVLSTVTTDAALAAAKASVPHLRSGQFYCDLNSTAPEVKVELDATIRASGAMFVEGAILGAIGVTGGRTKTLLGGPHAAVLSEILNQYGLQTSPYSDTIGRASTFKMLRSVFSKGLEALLIEFLAAGRAAGLEDDLWQEVTTLFETHGFEDVARNWVCSHGVAHERRYHEMQQVADLLKDMQQDAVMTEACVAFFRRSTEFGLADDFPSKPARMYELVDALMHRVSSRS